MALPRQQLTHYKNKKLEWVSVKKLHKNGLYYLASAFTEKHRPSPYKEQFEYFRFEAITKIGGVLKEWFNLTLIMPITTSYQLTKLCPTIGGGWLTWKKDDEKYLSVCDAMLIATEIPGWEDSTGVTDEIKYCRKHKIPIYLLSTESGVILETRDPKKLKEVLICRI